ncbi:insulinase family protein [Kingella kingae]|uniref:insulinase family protein n=1 Tax=Kingella kingae TaxID=504 RepID=UPI001E638119|nr:insulinase family protein [Kingella kingae]
MGDADSAQTLKWVQQYFGDLASKKQPARSDNTEIMQRDTSPVSITGKTKQPIMMFAYRVPHLQKMDDTLPYALDVLSTVLDGHSAARLSKNLVRGSLMGTLHNIGFSYRDEAEIRRRLSEITPQQVQAAAQFLQRQIRKLCENGAREIICTRKAACTFC